MSSSNLKHRSILWCQKETFRDCLSSCDNFFKYKTLNLIIITFKKIYIRNDITNIMSSAIIKVLWTRIRVERQFTENWSQVGNIWSIIHYLIIIIIFIHSFIYMLFNFIASYHFYFLVHFHKDWGIPSELFPTGWHYLSLLLSRIKLAVAPVNIMANSTRTQFHYIIMVVFQKLRNACHDNSSKKPARLLMLIDWIFTFVPHQIEESLNFFGPVLAAQVVGIPRFGIALLGVRIRWQVFYKIHWLFFRNQTRENEKPSNLHSINRDVRFKCGFSHWMKSALRPASHFRFLLVWICWS